MKTKKWIAAMLCVLLIGSLFPVNALADSEYTEYSISVFADGNGTATADKASYEKGETVTLAAAPNAGYHFKEWQSFDVTVSNNTFTMPEKDVTVKAIFEADAPTTYTVTFDAGDGSVTPASGTTGTDGKLASLPMPTRSGYLFFGWFDAPTGGNRVTTDTVFTTDSTIYARWAGGGVPQGGCSLTLNENWEDGTVRTIPNVSFYILPTIIRPGYVFDGWSTDPAGSVEYRENDAITLTADTTLYALWSKSNAPTLILNENWEFGRVRTIPNVSSYVLPTVTRLGETFFGWANVPNGVVRYNAGDTVTLTHDLTLYAVWDSMNGSIFYVIFDANGGTGTMKNLWGGLAGADDVSIPVTIPDCGFTREGYTFKGWATSPTGAVAYLPGASYKSHADLFLFAVWEQNEYHTVTYKVVNGTWSDGTIQDKTEVVVESTSPKQIPEGMNPSSGYTNGAWDSEPASAMIFGDTTFTYTFEKEQSASAAYTIVGYQNQGSDGAIAEVKINGETVPENTGGTLEIAPNAQNVSVEVEFNRGFTFGRWFDNVILRWGGVQSGSTNIDNSTDSGSIDMPGNDWFETEDQELYLIIQTQALPMYDVNVQTDGYGSASANPNPALSGEEVILTAMPDEGYRFKEWQSEDVIVTDNKFTMPAKAVTVTAVFEAIPTYTVTFEMKGHGAQVTAQTVEEGSKAEKPADPAAEGWIFGGWYADADCNAAFDFGSAITANTTVYAKWTKKTVPEPPVPVIYTIIAGADSEWTKGDTKGLLITSDAPFAKFYSVTVDGNTVAAANYTAVEGSTKITFLPVYLETLSIGSHSVRIISTDGSASTRFAVRAAPGSQPEDQGTPQTGDESHIMLWIILLLVSFAIMDEMRRDSE